MSFSFSFVTKEAILNESQNLITIMYLYEKDVFYQLFTWRKCYVYDITKSRLLVLIFI